MVCCCAFVLGVDVQVTKEDDAFIGAVGKINHNMFCCCAFVLDVNVHVTREDDACIGAVGKISDSMV